MNILTDLSNAYDPESPNFRPTEIYNESWLVKLVMAQASMIPTEDYPLSLLLGGSWYSEALLPTAFKAREQGDSLAEARTNADIVIGHFRIGHKAKADFELLETASQFTVVEAKVGAPLSRGTANAPYFDQAARSVACMAECLARADLDPASLERLDFIVLAPEKSIKKGTFADNMNRHLLKGKVKDRKDAYIGRPDERELKEWYKKCFLPTLERIRLLSLSWEEAIDWIMAHNPAAAEQLNDFYQLCLKFN